MSRSLAVIVLTLLSWGVQSQVIDRELWTEVKADVKLSKKWKFGVDMGFRTYDQLLARESFLLEPAVDYEPFKNFEIGVGYRFTKSYTDLNENRLTGNINYLWEPIKKWNFKFRLKYQSDSDIEETENTLRGKFEIDYNLSKLIDPFIGFEHFYNTLQKESEQRRYIIGIEIDLPDGMDIEVYYILRERFNTRNDGYFEVFGISLDLGNIKFKKEE